MAKLYRARTLFRRLPFNTFCRQLLAEAARHLLNPGAAYSYAQTGEDVVIAALLTRKENGYYVDVGCNHPTRMSNTFALYLRGFCGLAIDGNSEFEPLYRRLRPCDVFVHACVADEKKDVDFRVFRDRALSNMTDMRAFNDPNKYAVTRIEKLTTTRLDDILAQHHSPRTFDLLSIDVEGADLSVLRSINLTTYSPELIVLEAHDATAKSLANHDAVQFLALHGYEPKAFIASNILFKRS